MKLNDCVVGMKVVSNQNNFGTVYTIKSVHTGHVVVTCPKDRYMRGGVWIEDDVYTYTSKPEHLEPLP